MSKLQLLVIFFGLHLIKLVSRQRHPDTAYQLSTSANSIFIPSTYKYILYTRRAPVTRNAIPPLLKPVATFKDNFYLPFTKISRSILLEPCSMLGANVNITYVKCIFSILGGYSFFYMLRCCSRYGIRSLTNGIQNLHKNFLKFQEPDFLFRATEVSILQNPLKLWDRILH